MLVVCLGSLLHHVLVQPCKERRANIAGTLSCTALLMVAIVNMVRACFQSMETLPTGSSLEVSNWLDLVEDCLLLWIPLTGIGFVLLVLFGKTMLKITSLRCHTIPTPSENLSVIPMREQNNAQLKSAAD